jgi:hypothetical protein
MTKHAKTQQNMAKHNIAQQKITKAEQNTTKNH